MPRLLSSHSGKIGQSVKKHFVKHHLLRLPNQAEPKRNCEQSRSGSPPPCFCRILPEFPLLKKLKREARVAAIPIHRSSRTKKLRFGGILKRSCSGNFEITRRQQGRQEAVNPLLTVICAGKRSGTTLNHRALVALIANPSLAGGYEVVAWAWDFFFCRWRRKRTKASANKPKTSAYSSGSGMTLL